MSAITSILLGTIQGAAILRDSDGRVHFRADADIDADGANGQRDGIAAYRPDNNGLDTIRNAMDAQGRWCGIVLTAGGHQALQNRVGPNPCYDPGAYISTTSYQWKDKPVTDPDRYVDADSVPFIVVPPLIELGVKEIVLGSKARVTNLRNGKTVECVVADIGPTRRIGELSMAAARALGINPDPRNGGESDHVIAYELWPGISAVVNGITYPLQEAA